MSINRAPFNALVDDDGSNTVGSVWNKAAIAGVLLDPIDAALAAAGGVTLPINLATDVTGTLQAAQEPAHTGDVTNTAGSLALTLGPVPTSKLTGTLAAAQEPAHTGDVTNTAGSLALAIGAGKVTDAMLAGSIGLTKVSAPAPVALTDGASVAIDVAGRASYYRLVAAGDRTLAAPTNPFGGQKIVIMHMASGAARTLTLSGATFGFRFGSDIPALTQTASGKTDYIGAIYNLTDQKWDVVAVAKGF
jgi:hypothetical protein